MGTKENVLIPSSRDETLENEKDQAILEKNAENTRNRRDLQGIRGIAIIAVVLFHYFPAHFPNGYVGVDQFFVLSGFLMSMVTERRKRFTAREISLFYYRRSKRILPLYLLVLIGCVVITEACLFGSLHPTNWKSFYYASVFMTNIKATDSIREYNEMLSKARDFFTHTWSIAVEMQFYIIFPALFVIYKSIYLPISKPFLVTVGEFR
ncbi:acyltransferase [Cooperia oncophora]